MIKWEILSNNLAVKILSLVVALLLWFLVTSGKEAEQDFPVELQFRNVPQGLSIAGQIPDKLVVRVAGPRILLLRLQEQKIKLSLDMRNYKPGTLRFTDLDRFLTIPDELHVRRIYPSSIEVKLMKVVGHTDANIDLSGGKQ